MSMQLNEMGAWFFLRMRKWGIGRVGKFDLGRDPLWEKCFLNFLGNKTPKTTTFPSCSSVSPSLANWNEQNVFWNPIGHSRRSKQAKTTLRLNHHDFSPIQGSKSFTFCGFCVMIFPLFDNFVLSHVFSRLLVVFLNMTTMNPILCLWFERQEVFSFW